jgi:hypothetical protein
LQQDGDIELLLGGILLGLGEDGEQIAQHLAELADDDCMDHMSLGLGWSI